jgi:hypothetical protein
MAWVSEPASGSDNEKAARRSPSAKIGSNRFALRVGAKLRDQGRRDGMGIDHTRRSDIHP